MNRIDAVVLVMIINKLSVIVITKNEEKNIHDCLNTVTWANEIIVVDAQSTDRTVMIAKSFTPKVYVTEWKGFAEAKRYAIDKTSNSWILWIDADERVTPKLAEEIQKILKEDKREYFGYEVARRAYFLGKWIKHCGWYPGYVVRLFNKNKAKVIGDKIHERVEIDGSIGRLQNDLLHYTDDSLEHYFSKFNYYTTLAAEDLVAGNKKFSLFTLLIRPPFLFLKMYFFKLGFLDGIHGLILSALSSAYVFTKYAKLWEYSNILLKNRCYKIDSQYD